MATNAATKTNQVSVRQQRTALDFARRTYLHTYRTSLCIMIKTTIFSEFSLSIDLYIYRRQVHFQNNKFRRRWLGKSLSLPEIATNPLQRSPKFGFFCASFCVDLSLFFCFYAYILLAKRALIKQIRRVSNLPNVSSLSIGLRSASGTLYARRTAKSSYALPNKNNQPKASNFYEQITYAMAELPLLSTMW